MLVRMVLEAGTKFEVGAVAEAVVLTVLTALLQHESVLQF